MGEDNFPVEKVFDITAWKDEGTHMKIIKEDENVDLYGADAGFIFHDDFFRPKNLAKCVEQKFHHECFLIFF